MKVIVGYQMMEPHVPRMAAGAPGFDIEYRALQEPGALDALRDDTVEVLIAPRAPNDLAKVPNLRWLQLASAGIDGQLADPPWRRGLIVTNASGVYALSMGQYVLAELLHVYERLELRAGLQAARRWPEPAEEDQFTGVPLRDQTLLIVGYGGVGREVARLASAFGMRILAVKYDPHIREDRSYRVPGTGDPDGSIPDRIVGLDGLDDVLPEANVVVLTLPLTDRSRGLIGARQLAAMRRDAWLINVGRGRLTDEAELERVLRAGGIGGAIIDVFGTEPLPADSPFWGLPNVIVTPHVSGGDSTSPHILADLFTQNLRRYAAGEPLINVVDAERQY